MTISSENYGFIQDKYTKKHHPFDKDIDNHIGVKEIKNFMISAITDNDIFDKERSVGVIQMFNKNMKINNEDIERMKYLKKLIGGVSIKVSYFTLNVIMMVGLNMLIEEGDLNKKKQEFDQFLKDQNSMLKSYLEKKSSYKRHQVR